MTEQPRKLQIIGTEHAAHCDAETGVCRTPAERHADDGAATAEAPGASASPNATHPVT